MKIDITLSCPKPSSARSKQIRAMFDVPDLHGAVKIGGTLPLDGDWNVGLIVGPSGSGKSSVLRQAFGEPEELHWKEPCVLDDFADRLTIEEICSVCQAVGFNTVPAWLRPYRVLSNGEKFRVEVARRLLETRPDRIIALDEFTSVVDRQVAKIGSHAVQKWVRRQSRRLVVASCHFDLTDWLQPDWIFEPSKPSGVIRPFVKGLALQV